MADELPDFPGSDPLETNGQAISRSLTSSRSGRAPAIPLQFRQREQLSREQDHAWRKDIAGQKLELEKMTAQTAKESALLKAAQVRFQIVSRQAQIQQQRQELDHSTSAMEEFNGLDYKAGDFPNRLADIYRRNPGAMSNPHVASFAEKLLGMHQNYLKDFRTDSKSEAERAAAEATAKANNLSPTGVTVKNGATTTKFEKPVNSEKEDAAHLSRLESLRMRPSLSKAIGEVDDKGMPKTPEGRDAMDQIKYLDDQIKAVKGRIAARSPNAPDTTTPPSQSISVGNDPANSTIIVPGTAPTVLPVTPVSVTPTAVPSTPSATPAAVPTPVSTTADSSAPAPTSVATSPPSTAPDPLDDLHAHADAAIKAGAPVDVVKKRLAELGGNPARLTYDD